ncbi:integumentary mucin C.1-like [Mercenaria mercenaria]|uniref:integumentary mucin C.1-like n=1 Tax=Mercenaria mercenaria TaxID=6596 RepID=UPI00234ED47E|nr:integumentary mucin C.1-like [Mercenaria mercenaria]
MDIKFTIAVLLVTLGGRNGGHVEGSTTPAPSCLKGTCTGADESCLKNVTTKCAFIGSCTKSVTKTGKLVTVKVDCGLAKCPTTAPTPASTSAPTTASTAAPVTTAAPAASTTTSTAAPAPTAGRKRRAASTTPSDCCTTALCNQYQDHSPDSAAFRLQTNVFYFVGISLLLILLT